MKIRTMLMAFITTVIAAVFAPSVTFADVFETHGKAHHEGGFDEPVHLLEIGITIAILLIIVLGIATFASSLFKKKK